VQLQRDLWIAHLQLGRAALAAGAISEAERHARTSLEMALKLWPGSPADPGPMDDLADAHALAARVDARLLREANARPNFERAIALRQQLTREFPNEPAYASSLAELLSDAQPTSRRRTSSSASRH
jgi:hypothetical protein